MRRVPTILGVAFCLGLILQVVAGITGYFNSIGGWIVACCGIGLCIASGIVLLSSIFDRSANGASSIQGVVFVAILAITVLCRAILWTNPSENVLGGYDEGIYANTAINLAKTDDYYLYSSTLSSLDKEFRRFATCDEPAMANRSAHPPPRFTRYHVCLFVANQSKGRLASQFPIGFPALLGSAWDIGGVIGMKATNCIISLTATIILGLIATRWMGKPTGLAVTLIGLWLPLNIWGANSLFAEPLAQLLWVLALLAFTRSAEEPVMAGLLAGLALGLSLAVKIDAIPVAVASVGLIFFFWRNIVVFTRCLLGGFLVSGLVSFVSWCLFNKPYVETTLRALAETNRTGVISATIIGVCVLGFATLFNVSGNVRIYWASRAGIVWERVLPIIFCCGFVLVIYGYFFRPNVGAKIDTFYYWPALAEIRSFREATFFRFGWYWQPFGLAISLVGIALLLKRASTIAETLIIGIGLLYLISFAYDLRNNPIQPYAMRRFLPYAVPLMVLGAGWTGFAFDILGEWWRTILGYTVMGILLAGFWPINQRLNHIPEFPRLSKQIESLASLVPDNGIILLHDGSIQGRLATSLEFAYEKPSLLLRKATPLEFFSSTRTQIKSWQHAGKRVFLLSDRPNDDFGMIGVKPIPFASGQIQTRWTIPSAIFLETKQSTLYIPYKLSEIPMLP